MNVGFLSLRLHKSVVVLVILLLLLLASTATSYAQTGNVQHTVRRGEHLSGIAVRYGTTVQAIMNANPRIRNPNLIYWGTVLIIPTSAPQGTIHFGQPTQPVRPGCRFQHLVRPGDNLIRLGQHYGVSPFAIAEANRIYNLNRIFTGTYLCVP